MRLLRHFLVVERDELMEQNVQLTMIGRREGLPADVLAEFDRTAEMTGREHRDDPLPGGQLRRPDRDRRRRPPLAEDVRAGPDRPRPGRRRRCSRRISYTAGMPDPDLLIRTAGEMRISNFLLWQISYAELWVTDVALARLPRRRPLAGMPGVRRPRAQVRRAAGGSWRPKPFGVE